MDHYASHRDDEPHNGRLRPLRQEDRPGLRTVRTMIPRAAQAATHSVETFGLPDCDTHLIAKLRAMDPALRASILTTKKAAK
jgi:hypothetical protein